MNRRRVLPLDSLNFFAGGLNVKASSESKDITDVKESRCGLDSKSVISSPIIGRAEEKHSLISQDTQKVAGDIEKENGHNSTGAIIVSSPESDAVRTSKRFLDISPQQSSTNMTRRDSQKKSADFVNFETAATSSMEEDKATKASL